MEKKPLLTTAFIFALLFSALAGTQSTNLASGNPWGLFGPPPSPSYIYIRSDGNVEPSTAPIQKIGNIYTFINDLLNYSIIVQRDNIVIDGAGFMLQGNGYYEGITLSSRSNVTIKNMDINQVGSAIIMPQASNITIAKNRISGSSCLELSGSSHNLIAGNRIIGSPSGIRGSGSFNNITENNFAGTGYSVEIKGDNNAISGNFFDNDGSVRLGISSRYNTVSNNTMSGGRYGVYIYGGSSYNVVFGNTIRAKNENGIKIADSFNNIVYGNSLVKNEIGIYLANPAFSVGYAYSTDNTFYHNNLVDNTKSVHIEQAVEGGPRPNFWDKDKEGNYWSNYAGSDSNGDGISDTSYVICTNNADSYPLMKPIDISRIIDPNPPVISVISPETKNYTSSNVSLTFTLDEPASWIGYSLDGQANLTINGNTTITGLTGGSHSLVVYAKDTVGKMGASATVNFTVAQKKEPPSEPFPTILVVASVALVVVGAGLLVYFKKRKR